MSETADKPEIVYHYTTMSTMMKIAETATIWATSINYLNDVSEGDYFRELVRKRIPEYLITHQVDDPTIFDDFLNAPSETLAELRPFIASFSQDGDSLPQWRSYCPNGNGVAIGLRVDCLKRSYVKDAGSGEPSTKSLIRFVKVNYLDTMTSATLDDTIATNITSAEELAKVMGKGHTSGAMLAFLMKLLACTKKHVSFSNEREFRLIVDGIYSSLNCIEFRGTRSTLVPYVPLSIPLKKAGVSEEKPVENLSLSEQVTKVLSGRSDFIDRVVIGPSPNKVLSKTAVELFFRKRNMTVEVVSSDIPYRDW